MLNTLSFLPIPLLQWYGEHARDLPWRREPTPYRVWAPAARAGPGHVPHTIGAGGWEEKITY